MLMPMTLAMTLAMTDPHPFTLKIRVRYGECDAQQVVFNARYADYVDLAATEYYRALFGGYHALIASGYDTQVVRLDIHWRSPARFDEVLALEDLNPVPWGDLPFVQAGVVQINEDGTPKQVAEPQADGAPAKTDNSNDNEDEPGATQDNA